MSWSKVNYRFMTLHCNLLPARRKQTSCFEPVGLLWCILVAQLFQPACVNHKGKCPSFLSSAYMQHVQSWPTDPSNVVGGELAPGWHVEVKTRNSGTSAGTSDAVSLPALTHLSHVHCIQPFPVDNVFPLWSAAMHVRLAGNPDTF